MRRKGLNSLLKSENKEEKTGRRHTNINKLRCLTSDSNPRPQNSNKVQAHETPRPPNSENSSKFCKPLPGQNLHSFGVHLLNNAQEGTSQCRALKTETKAKADRRKKKNQIKMPNMI